MRAVYWRAFVALGAMVVLGGTGAVWYRLDRTAMVETVCRAGGPNLSRPRSVPARMLGCAVLGPKQRIVGVLQTSFENSTLFIGPDIQYGDGLIVNESAWFSTASGIMDRGGAVLRSRIDTLPGGTCGVAMATVTAEGWMTVSDGKFGHLGGWDQEFFADRIITASAPPAGHLEEVRNLAARALPPDICASMDAGGGELTR